MDDLTFDQIRKLGRKQVLWENRDVMRQWAMQDERDRQRTLLELLGKQVRPVVAPPGNYTLMDLMRR